MYKEKTTMEFTHEDINNAIHSSQHCQRNWDLSREIPEEDLNLIIASVTQCPSKQNIAYYKVHAITNRETITAIHAHTVGFAISADEETTNSQVLANLLLVFEAQNLQLIDDTVEVRSNETFKLKNRGWLTAADRERIARDRQMSVGIASGYCNILSSLLGYNTGYCACYDGEAVKNILGTSNEILLMLGIGFKDSSLDRRLHHINHSFIYEAKPKQKIFVNWIR